MSSSQALFSSCSSGKNFFSTNDIFQTDKVCFINNFLFSAYPPATFDALFTFLEPDASRVDGFEVNLVQLF